MERRPIIDLICARLAEGEPLAVICRDKGMPSRQTVYAWRDDDEDISGRIASARDSGFDVIAHRTRTVARGGEGSSGDVQRDKLIVDTDLKLLAKWDPKRYGERLDVVSDGKSIALDDTAAAARLASIFAAAQARKEVQPAE